MNLAMMVSALTNTEQSGMRTKQESGGTVKQVKRNGQNSDLEIRRVLDREILPLS